MENNKEDDTPSTTAVQVIEARNLVGKDQSGFSDPFCIMGVPSLTNTSFLDLHKCVKSETKFCDLAPKWKNAIFSVENGEVACLRVEVWDKNHDKPDCFLGGANIDIDPKIKCTHMWVPLLARSPADGVIFGEVHVVISKILFNQTLENQRQRMVRVFLSSTFLDMHEEREHIMHYTMVELERFCYELGVSLTYIDMRWGITDDMGQNAQTILRCLQEVDNSRPYFVAMLGQRYGWHQEVVGKDPLLTKTFSLAESLPEYSWIRNYRTSSVTELEILHGFLLHPHVPQNHVFCYLREPAFLDTLDAKKKSSFQDSSEFAICKLKELKSAIKDKAEKGMCKLSNYTVPKEMRKLLLDDLKTAISRDFPVIEDRKNAKSKLEHANYAHQRCVVYIPRINYYQAIQEATLGGESGKYLLITGQSGSGKSSLLANWWKLHTATARTFYHFIGLSAIASNFKLMILRLFNEINFSVELLGGKPLPLPSDELTKDDQLIQSIPVFLFAASQKGGITIVFDAVNQLQERYHNLHWLPNALPCNVNIIISALPKTVNEHSRKTKNMTTLEILPLEDSEKEEIITSRLRLYGKAISNQNMNKLIQHELSYTPIFLSTVLSEMCIIGFYTKFQQQFDAFLTTKTLPDLFQKVIARLEESFGQDLTQTVLLLVLCSRFGISEAQIQLLTQANSMEVFPLISAIKPHLVIQQGNLNFGHEYFKQAVKSRYSPQSILATYSKLASYWKAKPFDKQAAFEYPWLLSQMLRSNLLDSLERARIFNDIRDKLLDLNSFSVFYGNITLQGELIQIWDLLSQLDSKEWNMSKHYEQLVYSSRHEDIPAATYYLQLINLSTFLTNAGYIQAAQKIAKHSLEEGSRILGDDHPVIASLLTIMGTTTFAEQGNLEKAQGYLDRSLSISTKLFGEIHSEVAHVHHNLGVVCTRQGKLDESLKHHSTTLTIYTTLFGDSHPHVATSLCSIGVVLEAQGKLEESLEYQSRSLAMRLQFFGEIHPLVAYSINNLGTVYKGLGKLQEAKDHYTRALLIGTKLYGDAHPSVLWSLNSLGEVIGMQGRFEEGIDLCNKSLSRKLKIFGESHLSVAWSYNSIGRILQLQGKSQEAVEFHLQALSIYHTLTDKLNIAATHTHLGKAFATAGKFEEALMHHNEALSVRIQLFGDSHPQVAQSRANLLDVLEAQRLGK